ncbi:MAG TPA: SIMPL domain-containing protein [Nitrospiraceae bacterium]|nr:SIMPL domain-containing protein [Nitrospiraceae bacterium]
MRTMRVIALMIVFLVLPIAVLAGDGAKPEPPALTVAANGTVTVAPDTAFVTLGMETAGKSLAETQNQNSAVMQKVMERLRGLKIEKERIQTSSFTVSPHYKPPPKRPSDAPPVLPEIIGYTVSNTLTVEVRDLDKVASVIEEALSAGANHFHGLHWGLRDEQQARLNALKLAAAKARDKAATLGESLNVKLVRLVNVTEGGHLVRPAPHMARATMAMEATGGEVPISSGEIKVEATVTLVYEIAPN